MLRTFAKKSARLAPGCQGLTAHPGMSLLGVRGGLFNQIPRTLATQLDPSLTDAVPTPGGSIKDVQEVGRLRNFAELPSNWLEHKETPDYSWLTLLQDYLFHQASVWLPSSTATAHRTRPTPLLPWCPCETGQCSAWFGQHRQQVTPSTLLYPAGGPCQPEKAGSKNQEACRGGGCCRRSPSTTAQHSSLRYTRLGSKPAQTQQPAMPAHSV